MKIPVHRLLHIGDEKLYLDQDLDFSQLIGRHPQLVAVQPVTFKGQMYRQGNLIVLEGELAGSYTLQCSRCLEPYSEPFKLSVVERFDLSPFARDDGVDQEEDGEIHPVRGQILDLVPFLEEHILLSIPFVPSCGDEAVCRTKMKQQGKDWIFNAQPVEGGPDPRLAKLARFFEREKGV